MIVNDAEPVRFKLRLPRCSGGETLLEMDGQPLKNVRSIEIRAAFNEPTTVRVEYTNCEVHVEAEGDLIDVTAIREKVRKLDSGRDG